MRDWQSQTHVRWHCRYHLVFVPKYRHKTIYGNLRKDIGKILRELCQHQGVELIEGHAMPDHIHLLVSVPPKYSVANTVGMLKGKSAIRIHREYLVSGELPAYFSPLTGWPYRRSTGEDFRSHPPLLLMAIG
jgi:putative transposase